MLTRARLAFVPLVAGLLFLAACLPAVAQIHGVPPSVTSFGFGGNPNPTPGIPASVTSVGPLGFDCCGGPFIAPFQGGQFFNGGQSFNGHHHFHNPQQFPVGEMTPAVIPYYVPYPYPVPYEDYTGDQYGAEVDSTYSQGVPAVYDRGPWYREAAAPRYAPPPAPSERKEAAPAVAPEPTVEVAPQPATVLVYKDGHKMEVQNYAIFGDTLFDFVGDRSHRIQLADLDLVATRKTNDDRGVDFRIPSAEAVEGRKVGAGRASAPETQTPQ